VVELPHLISANLPQPVNHGMLDISSLGRLRKKNMKRANDLLLKYSSLIGVLSVGSFIPSHDYKYDPISALQTLTNCRGLGNVNVVIEHATNWLEKMNLSIPFGEKTMTRHRFNSF